MMKVGSLFSGVGGFDLGLEQAGMEILWQVEYDKQARGVLEVQWPDADLHTDVRCVGGTWDGYGPGRAILSPVDLVCGGFPCQNLSVAGKREGLAGDRSGLWWEFHRILGELTPKWALIENVPGLLSSNGGRDLALVLRGLEELGYGWSYRVLDSQYFGVAQRRRRLFIVGCLGAHCPPEILLEPQSVFRDSPPIRAQRTAVAGNLEGGAGVGGAVGRGGETIVLSSGQANAEIAIDHSPTLNRNNDGAPIVVGHENALAFKASHFTRGKDGAPREITPALSADADKGDQDILVFRKAQKAHDPDDCERWEEAERSDTLAGHGTTSAVVALGFNWQNGGGYGKAEDGLGITKEGTGPLDKSTTKAVVGGFYSTVPRRLTPVECERLQAFPDGWTSMSVKYKKEVGTSVNLADGPRYRQMGNAVTVTVARWIGERIITYQNTGVTL